MIIPNRQKKIATNNQIIAETIRSTLRNIDSDFIESVDDGKYIFYIAIHDLAISLFSIGYILCSAGLDPSLIEFEKKPNSSIITSQNIHTL